MVSSILISMWEEDSCLFFLLACTFFSLCPLNFFCSNSFVSVSISDNGGLSNSEVALEKDMVLWFSHFLFYFDYFELSTLNPKIERSPKILIF